MTEAEKFLFERLNPQKSPGIEPQHDAKSEIAGQTLYPGLLSRPTFAGHRIFWSIGFTLLIVLCDLLIMAATNAFEAIDNFPRLYDDDALALIVSFLTPATFWIPLLAVARWAWNRQVAMCLSWGAAVWMSIIHILKLVALLKIRWTSSGHGLTGVIGFIVFLIGALVIGAAIRGLLAKKTGRKPMACGNDGMQEAVQEPSPRQRQIRIKCASCGKSYKLMVASPDDVSTCPHCGLESRLCNIEADVKEPLACQIVRAVICILGWIVIISVIGAAFDRFDNYPLGSFAFIIAFCFGFNAWIRHGSIWPRYLLLAVDALLLVSAFSTSEMEFHCFSLFWCLVSGFLFLPQCNAWFGVKRMLHKSKTDRNNP